MPLSRQTIKRLSRLYNEEIKSLMNYEAFGRRCLFIYPPKRIPCPNCIVTSAGLSGPYKIGGPIPFSEGMICPYCMGKGIFDEHVEEEDIVIVLFDKNMFMKPGQVAQLPDNTAMMIGERAKTWDKVVRAERVILNTDVYGKGSPYVRYSEPLPVGLLNSTDQSGSKWFYCYYSRDGGG